MLAETLLALAVASASPQIEDSVVILFTQTEDGGMRMACTATAFPKDDLQRLGLAAAETAFLTAAHCITEKGRDEKDRVIEDPIFLSPDDRNVKSYVRATIREVGKRENGYDYAILSAALALPVIPLGDERTESSHVGVVNVAAPKGIGKAYDRGHVSLRYIDRPLRDNDQKIDWSGSMLVRVQAEGGSSGSAIVSEDTRTIIGILVGHHSGLVIAVPVSRVMGRDPEFVLYPKQKK